MLELLPGVTSHHTQTDRLNMHYLSYGPEDGIPTLLIHGNLTTGGSLNISCQRHPRGTDS
jgi:hypothetical protein